MIEVSIKARELFARRDCELEIQLRNAGPGTCTDIVFRIGLPREFLLLRGQDRLEIPDLGEGEAWLHRVTVRPRAPGNFTVTSANFSYRNQYGAPVRVPDFRAGLTVLSGSQETPAGPDLGVAVISGPLSAGEWEVLRLRVQNDSRSPLRGLTLTIAGPFRIAAPGLHARLPDLKEGQGAEVSFIVCPAEIGHHVPAQVRITYSDLSGRQRAQKQTVPLMVSGSVAGPRPAEPDTILFLAASPADMPPLRPDKEIREIRERLQLGRYRDRFRLESAVAVRFKDIGQALADYDPRIVHFAGHGEADGSLYVEDERGHSQPVAAGSLAGLFKLHQRTIDLVVVNACDTLLLAQAIAPHIRHVIAMRCKIGDTAAIDFSTGFYQGLASGAPVAEAFARGQAFLLRDQPGKIEDDTAVLMGPWR